MKDHNDLTEHTLAHWIDPPVHPVLNIYMFNLTNPDEFLQGAKPRYQEIGPYVFTDTWEKDNVQWKNGDDSIEYSQLRYFKFKPGPSKGQLRDEIIIPNIPMIVRSNIPLFLLVYDRTRTVRPNLRSTWPNPRTSKIRHFDGKMVLFSQILCQFVNF